MPRPIDPERYPVQLSLLYIRLEEAGFPDKEVECGDNKKAQKFRFDLYNFTRALERRISSTAAKTLPPHVVEEWKDILSAAKKYSLQIRGSKLHFVNTARTDRGLMAESVLNQIEASLQEGAGVPPKPQAPLVQEASQETPLPLGWPPGTDLGFVAAVEAKAGTAEGKRDLFNLLSGGAISKDQYSAILQRWAEDKVDG